MDPAVDGPTIRGRLGVCPQEDNLDQELNVFDNLYIYGRYFGLPKQVVRDRVGELLEFAKLTEKAKSKVDELSGGMKRRLTIAAVAHQPPRAAAARRADHRPRPTGPAPALGPAVPAQARGRDPGHHHALHGRGRAAVRPARDHGQGRDRRRGGAAST